MPIFLAHEVAFDVQVARETVRSLPAGAAVFALRGQSGEPYLGRTPNLQARLNRLLLPAPAQSKRLQLAAMVRAIEWSTTASDFGAELLLYRAAQQAFGERVTQRMHLRTPFYLRMSTRNRFPRVWATNSLALNALADLFGPFPSRTAAERYAEQLLDLHLLRRCYQDLEPDPAFPGCIYSEMHKCLAPCFAGCTQQRYDDEAAAVHAFLRTRGESLRQTLAEERDRASGALDFEAAAAAHARLQKAEAVQALVPQLAGSIADQHAVLVQPASEPDHFELFLLTRGLLRGPVRVTVLGMRLPNEASGSSSLFAHPAAFAPVPLGGSAGEGPATPEDRLHAALLQLEAMPLPAGRLALCHHQALVARWFFRPQHKRVGEMLFAASGAERVAIKPLVRAAARVYVATLPAPATQQS